MQLHVPTLYSCRFLGVIRSGPRRHPSCLQNTTTLYRHLKAAGSWEWYDHGHNGTPRVCRIQLHCTDTLQLQVLRSGTITATTAPLVFVEYNYIVPTPYSCRFLGVVRSRPKRHPSCLQNTTTLYRHLTAAGSWEWYDHGHDAPPPPSYLQNTTTLYRHLTAAGSWEWYDHGHDGTPHVCRIQLHCTDTLQLQVLGSGTITQQRHPSCLQNTTTLYRHPTVQVHGSGTITTTTAPLMFVEYNYIVPTPHSCRFVGVVRSRPRRHPSCLQNTTTLYDTLQCRFLGVVQSQPRRHPSCLQNTTTF